MYTAHTHSIEIDSFCFSCFAFVRSFARVFFSPFQYMDESCLISFLLQWNDQLTYKSKIFCRFVSLLLQRVTAATKVHKTNFCYGFFLFLASKHSTSTYNNYLLNVKCEIDEIANFSLCVLFCCWNFLFVSAKLSVSVCFIISFDMILPSRNVISMIIAEVI